MAKPRRIPWITPDDYLAMERNAEVRHEYVDGHVYAMVGSSRRHSLIAGGLHARLFDTVRRRGCEIHQNDVKVRVEAANAFYYPDLVVTCSASDDDEFVVREPLLIVEVLSPSTEGIDRREKLFNYRKIPSLREYVVLAQDGPRAEIHRRAGSGWTMETVTDGDLVIESLDVVVPLADLHR